MHATKKPLKVSRIHHLNKQVSEPGGESSGGSSSLISSSTERSLAAVPFTAARPFLLSPSLQNLGMERNFIFEQNTIGTLLQLP